MFADEKARKMALGPGPDPGIGEDVGEGLHPGHQGGILGPDLVAAVLDLHQRVQRKGRTADPVKKLLRVDR